MYVQEAKQGFNHHNEIYNKLDDMMCIIPVTNLKYLLTFDVGSCSISLDISSPIQLYLHFFSMPNPCFPYF